MAIKFENGATAKVGNTSYFAEDELSYLIYQELNKLYRDLEQLEDDYKNGRIKKHYDWSPETVYQHKKKWIQFIINRLEQGKTCLYDRCDYKGNYIGEYEPSRFAAFGEYFERKEQEEIEKRNEEIKKNLKYNI